MYTWVRAVWIEGDVEEEGTIPRTWARDGFVYWPPGTNAYRVMKEGRAPGDNWTKFPLKKIKHESASRSECETYDLTTTVEDDSESEVEVKRQPKKKSFEDFVTDGYGSPCEKGENNKMQQISRDDDCAGPERIDLPNPPKKMKVVVKKKGLGIGSLDKKIISREGTCTIIRNDHMSSSSSPERDDPVSGSRSRASSRSRSWSRSQSRSRSRSKERSSSIEPSPATPKSRPSFSPSRNTTRTTPPSPLGSLRSPRQRSSNLRDVYPMAEAKFQKRVMFILADIRQQLAELKRENKTADTDTATNAIWEVSTLEELTNLEQDLKLPENRQQMVEKLSAVGGFHLRDGVKKMMEKLMTNELMSGINLKGNKGKIAFEKTALCKVINATAVKQFKTTEHEATTEISRCLKYAPDRKGGSGRKTSTSSVDL